VGEPRGWLRCRPCGVSGRRRALIAETGQRRRLAGRNRCSGRGARPGGPRGEGCARGGEHGCDSIAKHRFRHRLRGAATARRCLQAGPQPRAAGRPSGRSRCLGPSRRGSRWRRLRRRRHFARAAPLLRTGRGQPGCRALGKLRCRRRGGRRRRRARRARAFPPGPLGQLPGRGLAPGFAAVPQGRDAAVRLRRGCSGKEPRKLPVEARAPAEHASHCALVVGPHPVRAARPRRQLAAFQTRMLISGIVLHHTSRSRAPTR